MWQHTYFWDAMISVVDTSLIPEIAHFYVISYQRNFVELCYGECLCLASLMVLKTINAVLHLK